MQQGLIKIGGSGGGWKSRLKGVDGCSNGVTVGEIALVVFYYSIICITQSATRSAPSEGSERVCDPLPLGYEV